MFIELPVLGVIALGAIAFIVSVISYIRERNLNVLLKRQHAALIIKEKEKDHRMYELSILKELGERVGYSLDVHKIMDIITGSLHQFIDYSTVSYILIEPEDIIFNIHLEESVNRRFIDVVKEKMLNSLYKHTENKINKKNVKEVLSGAIIAKEINTGVGSFFDMPLVINKQVVGILSVANTKRNFYKEEELDVLRKIINQASNAVTKLQEVVKTEQSKLNSMVESMADGVVMTDTDYRIMVTNPAVCRALGISNKKDLTIFDLIDSFEGKFDIRGRLEESIKFNKEFTSEDISLGDKFYKIFVFPVGSSNSVGEKEMLGGVVIFHDVTNEIEVERVREDFRSMIVHELRSPLSGIQKISELLIDGTVDKNSEKFQEYLKLLQNSSTGILELVNDILDIAKIEAGKFDIKIEEAKIRETIDNRIAFYKATVENEGKEISSSVSQKIPEKYFFDDNAIKQVLNNLISNALKYTSGQGFIHVNAFMHETGKNIEDELSEQQQNIKPHIFPKELNSLPNSLIIYVGDNGAGIKESDKNVLFDRFKQLESSKAEGRKKGTGLGLSIVRGIVEEHNGVVGVVSDIGYGSIFYFTIPSQNK